MVDQKIKEAMLDNTQKLKDYVKNMSDFNDSIIAMDTARMAHTSELVSSSHAELTTSANNLKEVFETETGVEFSQGNVAEYCLGNEALEDCYIRIVGEHKLCAEMLQVCEETQKKAASIIDRIQEKHA